MFKKSELWVNRYLYLIALPGLLIYAIIAYGPLPGIIIAFKKYNFVDGITKSPWADNHGIYNFIRFFTNQAFIRITVNTLWINFNNILWDTILAVIFAILLNEVKNNIAKRSFQFFMFLPYFFSAMIISQFVYLGLNNNQGIVNHIITTFGGHAINWYLEPKYWVKIIVGAQVWKHIGYSVIIYLATIIGIDSELFEAAGIDGAGRLQQIRYVLIPHLIPTVIILVLLAVGKIFFGNFTMIWALTSDSGALIPTTDVIETYIYRSITKLGLTDYGYMGAVSFYQTVVGFILVFGSNLLAKLFDKEYALF